VTLVLVVGHIRWVGGIHIAWHVLCWGRVTGSMPVVAKHIRKAKIVFTHLEAVFGCSPEVYGGRTAAVWKHVRLKLLFELSRTSEVECGMDAGRDGRPDV
jgi:hypothetical protein